MSSDDLDLSGVQVHARRVVAAERALRKNIVVWVLASYLLAGMLPAVVRYLAFIQLVPDAGDADAKDRADFLIGLDLSIGSGTALAALSFLATIAVSLQVAVRTGRSGVEMDLGEYIARVRLLEALAAIASVLSAGVAIAAAQRSGLDQVLTRPLVVIGPLVAGSLLAAISFDAATASRRRFAPAVAREVRRQERGRAHAAMRYLALSPGGTRTSLRFVSAEIGTSLLALAVFCFLSSRFIRSDWLLPGLAFFFLSAVFSGALTFALTRALVALVTHHAVVASFFSATFLVIWSLASTLIFFVYVGGGERHQLTSAAVGDSGAVRIIGLAVVSSAVFLAVSVASVFARTRSSFRGWGREYCLHVLRLAVAPENSYGTSQPRRSTRHRPTRPSILIFLGIVPVVGLVVGLTFLSSPSHDRAVQRAAWAATGMGVLQTITLVTLMAYPTLLPV